MSQLLHEVSTGAVGPFEGKRLREQGGYAVPMCLFIDAYSVFASITATFIKPPADSSLLCHVQYLRECLDNRALDALFWSDTRDMIADGLTKGSCERELLHLAMQGMCRMLHKFEAWRPKSKHKPEVQLD